MIFTQGQIQDMLSILKRYELIFIASQLGLDFLSQADKALLLAAGIDLDSYKNKNMPFYLVYWLKLSVMRELRK